MRAPGHQLGARATLPASSSKGTTMTDQQIHHPVSDDHADNASATAPLPPLSLRQRRVLAVIRNHLALHGFPPSVREIGAAVGLGPSATHYQLRQLQEKGYIRRDPVRARALVVVDQDEEKRHQLQVIAGGAS